MCLKWLLLPDTITEGQMNPWVVAQQSIQELYTQSLNYSL